MSKPSTPKIVNRRRFLVQSAASLATLPLINTETLAGTSANSKKPDWLKKKPKHCFNESGWAEGGTQSMIASFPPRRDPFASGLGNTCTLQEQTIIGPCYFDNVTTEDDISEGEPGVPMGLVLRLTDLNCQPIKDANIEIWWANAAGIYSGDSSGSTNGVGTEEESLAIFGPDGPVFPPVSPENPPPFELPLGEMSKFFPTECSADGDEEAVENALQSKFFRGIKVTNKKGDTFFKGCFPGWYAGRAPHIHVRVTLNDRQWVYQLGFDDDLSANIYSNHPDYTGIEQDTKNENDFIFLLKGGIDNHELEIRRQFDGSMLAYKALQVDV